MGDNLGNYWKKKMPLLFWKGRGLLSINEKPHTHKSLYTN